MAEEGRNDQGRGRLGGGGHMNEGFVAPPRSSSDYLTRIPVTRARARAQLTMLSTASYHNVLSSAL